MAMSAGVKARLTALGTRMATSKLWAFGTRIAVSIVLTLIVVLPYAGTAVAVPLTRFITSTAS